MKELKLRKVNQQGIKFDNRLFWNKNLISFIGKKVFVVMTDQGLHIYKDESSNSLICVAKEGKKDGEDMFGIGGKKIDDIETKELVKELVRRTGVTSYRAGDNIPFKVHCNGKRVKDMGKATILIVRG